MADPESKQVVITGVSRGLGRAMAERFIELGHTVSGCGRSADAVEQLQKRCGPQHDFAVVDVANDSQVRAWARRLIAKYEPPDLLINNAALINENNPLWQISAEEFDQLIDVNIKGVANVIRHFAPAMVARGTGVIVNFSSGWGRSTEPDVAPYCASKFAIEGLTKALAKELPSGMAAIPLNPGVIDTAMLRGTFGEAAKDYRSPEVWATTAVPYLLRLGPKDNGRSLNAP